MIMIMIVIANNRSTKSVPILLELFFFNNLQFFPKQYGLYAAMSVHVLNTGIFTKSNQVCVIRATWNEKENNMQKTPETREFVI